MKGGVKRNRRPSLKKKESDAQSREEKKRLAGNKPAQKKKRLARDKLAQQKKREEQEIFTPGKYLLCPSASHLSPEALQGNFGKREEWVEDSEGQQYVPGDREGTICLSKKPRYSGTLPFDPNSPEPPLHHNRGYEWYGFKPPVKQMPATYEGDRAVPPLLYGSYAQPKEGFLPVEDACALPKAKNRKAKKAKKAK